MRPLSLCRYCSFKRRSLRSITVKILVVTVCTTGFNMQKFYSPTTQYIYVLLTDLRRKRLCSLRGTNWIFNIIQANFDLSKPWYDSDGSHFVSWSILWDLCWTEWHWYRVFASASVIHCHYHSISAPYAFLSPRCFTRKRGGRKWGTLQTAMVFRKPGIIAQKINYTCPLKS